MDEELISLLYIYDSKIGVDLSKFSKMNGFVLHECGDIRNAYDYAKSTPPDLIIIEVGKDNAQDECFKQLFKIDFKFKPAVFLSLSHYPDSENRLALMNKGCDDFLIRPFFVDEVRKKYGIYHQVKYAEQKIFSQEIKIEKSFSYLDKFKGELKEIKTELFEEKTTLNNALKQINQMTIERKRFKKEIKKSKKALLNTIDGFSNALSNLITIRVEKNRGHSERVIHIIEFIAKQLKFDEKKLEDLRKAAMLHEVGLLFIPQKTLQKPKDELSDYEKELFNQYAVKGADLLSKCTELKNSAEIVRYLNEHSDGSGKPQGLKRKYIPLLSRILSGADVFDTLKDDKDVSSLERFLEKLESFSGTILDPNIVVWLEKYAVLHMGADSYAVRGVGVHQLEPGMTLGTGLFTHTGTKLFSVNTLLTQDAIDKIKKYDREYPVDETVYIRA
ncbi:MAG: HD domain-containing protein [Desulfobacteraceae bacterium]|nr:HD domain-containing protein [Desulfobacteraceae bacterium]